MTRYILSMLIVSVTASAWQVAAQDPAKKPGPPMPWKRPANGGSPFPPNVETEQLKGNGELKEVSGGALHVAGSSGEWLVYPNPQAKISYSGSADLSWLQPGMFVRFTGNFDKKGKLQTPVMSLEVFSPGPMTRMGVAGESSGNSEFPEAANLFKDNAAPQKKKAVPESASYTVTGRLTSIRGTKFSVSAGSTVVPAEFDERAKVSFEFSDLKLAKQNDKVEFDGTVAVSQKNHVWPKSISVTAAEPLTGMMKKKASAEKGDAGTPAEKGEAKAGEKAAEAK